MRRIFVFSILGLCACAATPTPVGAPISLENAPEDTAPAPTPVPVDESTGLKPVGGSLSGIAPAVAEPPREPTVAAVASEKVATPDPPTVSFTFFLPYEEKGFDEATLRKHVWRVYPGAIVEVRETGDEFEVVIKGLSPEVAKNEQESWHCAWLESWSADILQYEEGMEEIDDDGYPIGLHVEEGYEEGE